MARISFNASHIAVAKFRQVPLASDSTLKSLFIRGRSRLLRTHYDILRHHHLSVAFRRRTLRLLEGTGLADRLGRSDRR